MKPPPPEPAIGGPRLYSCLTLVGFLTTVPPCRHPGGDDFSGLAAVAEGGGSAQIHLPLPRDDARGRAPRGVPGRHPEAAGGRPAPGLRQRPRPDRSVQQPAQ